MKKPIKQTVGDFLVGRGFYIVLFLCVAAIGVSGWYLMSELFLPGGTAVAAPTAVVTTTSPMPTIPPTVPPVPLTTVEPSASAKPTPAPTPVPATPTPAATPIPSAAASLWGSQIYTWPVKGEVISDFSLEVLAYDETMGDWRVHEGVDVAAQVGTTVKVINAGTVTAVYEDDLMGTVVEVDHGKGLTSLYANLAHEVEVKVGDGLDTAAVIGMVGQTAIAEIERPAHLHFEMRQDGVNVDPVLYLPQQ